jgi:hypothetical protein
LIPAFLNEISPLAGDADDVDGDLRIAGYQPQQLVVAPTRFQSFSERDGVGRVALLGEERDRLEL